MKKIILSILAAASFQFSQAQVNVTIDSSGTGCFGGVNLVANVTGPMGTQSYTFAPIPFAPEAFGGTPVNLFDDDVTGALQIGFPFCFLGSTYTQFYLGSNGWISFSPGQTTAYTAAPIPNTNAAVPKNAVMGPWEDWNPGIGGQITYQTLGTAPNRRLVVSWNAVPMFSCTSTSGTFQIVLHEATSLIENHLTAKPNCPAWANGQGTQGLHNDLGTVAFVDPARNSTQWTAYNESTAFIPDGIVWYLNGSIVGQGDTLPVAAGASGTYIAQVTLCDGTTEADSVTISPTSTSAQIDFTPTSCNGDSSGNAFISILNGNVNDYAYQWNDYALQTTDTAFNLPAGTYTVVVTGLVTPCTDSFTVTVTEPSPVTAVTEGSVACDNTPTGTIDVTPAGGNAPYTYSIDNGANFQALDTFYNLVPGIYDIIVMDATGCTSTYSDTVFNQPLPDISNVVFTDPSCIASDGTIDITVNGTSTYYYSIDNGASFGLNNQFGGLGVGTYDIIVQDIYGCFSDTSVTLVNPQAPVIDNITSIAPSCGQDDGSISLTVSGSNPPFTYSFDAGVTYGPNSSVTNLPPGGYNIIVVDANGCTATSTVNFTTNTIPIIDAVNITPIICPGDSGTFEIITSGGAGPHLYSIDGGANFETTNVFTPLGAGTYNIVVIGTNGCSSDTIITLNPAAPLVASFTSNPDFGPDPLTVDFINTSVGASSYQWFFGDGDTSTVVSPSHIYSPKGMYTVTLVASNGLCTDTMTWVIDVRGESHLFIPNVFTPNNDGYNDNWAPVTTNIATMDVFIYNQWGNLLHSWSGTTGFWDGGNSPDGTYFYVITATGTDGTNYSQSGSFTLLN